MGKPIKVPQSSIKKFPAGHIFQYGDDKFSFDEEVWYIKHLDKRRGVWEIVNPFLRSNTFYNSGEHDDIEGECDVDEPPMEMFLRILFDAYNSEYHYNRKEE